MPRKRPSPARRLYFTDDSVRALKPPRGGGQLLVWDAWVGNPRGKNLPDPARGLCLLISPLGTKSFRCAFYYPADDKTHFMNLGRLDETIKTVQQARELAKQAREKASRGEDPRAGDPLDSDKFSNVLDRYIDSEQKGRRGNVSANANKGVILHHCKPWLAKPLGTIRNTEIDALLEAIRDGSDGKPGKPYMANRLYSHLRHFFGWAAAKHLITASPMADLERPFVHIKSRSFAWFKGRAGDEAIKALWKAAGEIGGVEGKYLKTMLLLGKRKTALASMQWQDIGDDWFWDAPESKTKNKRLHGVPLPGLAQEILSPAHDGENVLPLHRRPVQGPVFGLTEQNLDTLQDRVRQLTGLADFIWHGVRHLVESKTAEIGIPPHVRDMLFDHASKHGSGKGYDHHSYRPEMSEALESWAGHVEQIVQKAEGVAVQR
jgi:integrase